MNRFYKPTPREYVSSYAELPWEFLQGVAEQKQKAFDKTGAELDAVNKLLNFDSIPGDIPGKQMVQQEYNQRLMKERDNLLRTMDVRTTSRNVLGIVNDIINDKRIINMKNALDPHKRGSELDEKLASEGAPMLGRRFDPMARTYNPETNESTPYKMNVGYDARKMTENFNKDLESQFDNVAVTQYGYTKMTDGTYKDIDGHYITYDRLKKIMQEALPSLKTAYSTFLSDLGKDDVNKGWEPGKQASNMINRAILERVQQSEKSKTRERESWTGKTLQDYAKTSDLMVTTGETTPVKFSYNQYQTNIDSNNKSIELLQKQLSKATTNIAKQKIQSQIDNLKQQNYDQKQKMSLVDQHLSTSSNMDELYDEYVNFFKESASPTVQNMKPKSKQEFANIMSGKKDIEYVSGQLWGHPNSKLSQLKVKYKKIADQVAGEGAYTTTNEYIRDINPSGRLNKITNAYLDAVFSGTASGTVSGDNEKNVNTLIKKEYPNASKTKSQLVTVRNPNTGSVQYQITFVNENGEYLGSEMLTPDTRDQGELGRLVGDTYVQGADDAFETGNAGQYAQNIQNLAYNSHGEDIAKLKSFNSENKIIPQSNPVKVGRFYVFNDPDDKDLYYMAQGKMEDGNVILSNYEKGTLINPDGSRSNILQLSDILGKLGQEAYQKAKK